MPLKMYNSNRTKMPEDMVITLASLNVSSEGTSHQSQQQQWLMDPTLYLDGYLSVCHLICAVVGIPLNVSVMTAIISLQRLRSQRFFTWLGIGFSNLFILFFYLTEFFTVHWPSPAADELCAWLNGLPCPALLMNYFLSLLERRFCLKYPNWYRNHVTNGGIVSGQLGTFLLLCLAFKGRYLFGAVPLRWQLSFPELKIFCSFFLAGFVLCIAGGAAVWTISSRPYPSVSIDRQHQIALRPVLKDNNTTVEEGEDDEQGSNGTMESPFVRIGEARVSRLDVIAARSVAISGASLLVVASPALITLVLLAGCLQYGSPEELAHCAQWVRSFYYLRELLPVHCSFVSPVILVALSREIRGALRDKGRRLEPSSCLP